MSVDRAEVARIAALARLRLDDDEVERLTEEMNRILQHATRLREVSDDDGPDTVDEGEGGGSGRSGTRHEAAEEPDALASGLEGFARCDARLSIIT